MANEPPSTEVRRRRLEFDISAGDRRIESARSAIDYHKKKVGELEARQRSCVLMGRRARVNGNERLFLAWANLEEEILEILGFEYDEVRMAEERLRAEDIRLIIAEEELMEMGGSRPSDLPFNVFE